MPPRTAADDGVGIGFAGGLGAEAHGHLDGFEADGIVGGFVLDELCQHLNGGSPGDMELADASLVEGVEAGIEGGDEVDIFVVPTTDGDFGDADGGGRFALGVAGEKEGEDFFLTTV